MTRLQTTTNACSRGWRSGEHWLSCGATCPGAVRLGRVHRDPGRRRRPARLGRTHCRRTVDGGDVRANVRHAGRCSQVARRPRRWRVSHDRDPPPTRAHRVAHTGARRRLRHSRWPFGAGWCPRPSGCRDHSPSRRRVCPARVRPGRSTGGRTVAGRPLPRGVAAGRSRGAGITQGHGRGGAGDRRPPPHHHTAGHPDPSRATTSGRAARTEQVVTTVQEGREGHGRSPHRRRRYRRDGCLGAPHARPVPRRETVTYLVLAAGTWWAICTVLG